MLVKTIFDKFKKFPWEIMGTEIEHIRKTILKTSIKPTSPSVYFVENYNIYAFFPDSAISIDISLPTTIFDKLNQFINDLHGKQLDDFLVEYATYSTLLSVPYSRLCDWAIEPLAAVKQDVLDILESYSVSKKLLERLGSFNMLIPIALADILGHIFYQIYALNSLTGDYSVIFTGVGSTGFSIDLKKQKTRIFPWDASLRLIYTAQDESFSSLAPLLWANALFGASPTMILPNKNRRADAGVSKVEQYLRNLFSLNQLELASKLSVALNYQAFIDELVPDSTLEKIKNGATLSETERENFSKFLDIIGAILYIKNTDYVARLYSRSMQSIHVRLLLQDLSLKEVTASKLPEKVLELAGCKPQFTFDQKRYYMEHSDLPKVVSYKKKTYVLGPELLTVWGYQVGGVDWKQVKEKFLEGLYRYDG